MDEDQLVEANRFSGPIPGGSLTNDPDNPAPYEQPPEYTKLEDFVDDMFLNVTQEDAIDGILDPIRQGIPIDKVAEVLLFSAFSEGKINMDLYLGALEPTAYMLMGLSQYAGIENAEFYPEGDDEFSLDGDEQMDLQELMGKRKKAEPEKVPDLEEVPVPKGISKSLLQKLQEQTNMEVN